MAGLNCGTVAGWPVVYAASTCSSPSTTPILRGDA
jgi:hypothetical protein